MSKDPKITIIMCHSRGLGGVLHHLSPPLALDTLLHFANWQSPVTSFHYETETTSNSFVTAKVNVGFNFTGCIVSHSVTTSASMVNNLSHSLLSQTLYPQPFLKYVQASFAPAVYSMELSNNSRINNKKCKLSTD